jgi:hypothetical protein
MERAHKRMTATGCIIGVLSASALVAHADASTNAAADKATAAVAAGFPAPPQYAYMYKDKVTTLVPSLHYVAVFRQEQGQEQAEAVGKDLGLTLDPRSESAALKPRGVLLFNVGGAVEKLDENARQISLLLLGTNDVPVQPVFDQAGALLIPSDEIIVSFRADTTLEKAKEFLTDPHREWDVADVREQRPRTFIATIRHPFRGRCYRVCLQLAREKPIAFAEPNPITLMRGQ